MSLYCSITVHAYISLPLISSLRLVVSTLPRRTTCSTTCRQINTDSVVNQRLWERARKWGNPGKWLGEGAKGLLNQGSKGLPSVSCTIRTLLCAGAPHVAPGQKAFCSLGPKDLLHPHLTTFGNFPFRALFQILWFAMVLVVTMRMTVTTPVALQWGT